MYEQSAILALERPGNRENSGVLRTKQHFARMAMNDTELRGKQIQFTGAAVDDRDAVVFA